MLDSLFSYMQYRNNWLVIFLVIFFVYSSNSRAINTVQLDPLKSVQWSVMHKRFLNNEPVVFDDKVKVFAPKVAEDSLNVPVSFKVEQLPDIQEIVVVADFNPLPLVLKFYPGELEPNLSFRMKLQQGSPIRVAVKTADGIWHVGGTWIDATGGGCTLPSTGTASGDWMSTLGQVSARLWQKPETSNRLRIKVMHPMDTGLASGVPKFHIEKLELKNIKSGEIVAKLELYEPVSENPKLSLDVGDYLEFLLEGVDNNGNKIKAQLVQ